MPKTSRSRRSASEKQPHTPKARPGPVLERADISTMLLELSDQFAPADLANLMVHEPALRATAERLPAQLSLLRQQLQLGLDCLRDHVDGKCPQIPFSTISLLGAAVYYFARAKDAIPDFLPRIGRLDDAAVMAIAFELGQEGIRRYCASKGRAGAAEALLGVPAPA